MAFSSLLSNQMVSHAEAATGGFTLNSGKTNPGGTQMMTKAMAFDMYNLAVTADTNSIATNQLMQRSFWSSGITGIAVGLIDTTATGLPGTCAVAWIDPITKYTKTGLLAWDGTSPQASGIYSIYNDVGCTSFFQIINKLFKAFEGGVYKSVVGDTHSDNVVQVNTCGPANSVSFTSWYYQSGTNIYPSTSGTVTIVGASATFNASAVGNSPSSLSDVLITINGVSRTAVKSGSGTTNSTTFSLAPGTYSYSVSVSFDALCSGGIVFTQ